MLKAVKAQLSLLAIERGADFAEQIRGRYGRSNVQWAVSKATNLVLILPDLIARIRDFSADRTLRPEWRRLNQYVLVYLYHPHDFVSDDKSGLLGYLDDAYLVGSVYSRMKKQARIPAGADDLTRDLDAALEVTRGILPKETRKIDHLIEELSRDKREVFEKLMNRSKPAKRSS